MKKISRVNIRATSLPEFWGTEYENSVYLWEGAKHGLTLDEITENPVPTVEDIFPGPDERAKADGFCRTVYERLLPRVAEKLDEIHGLDLPVSFWETAFGRWLYRHISIAWEKFSYLSLVDTETTDIILLDEESFYVPEDHYDYLRCFGGDFGVQQLVSVYYRMFSGKTFPAVRRKYSFDAGAEVTPVLRILSRMKKRAARVWAELTRRNDKIETALCNVYYTDEVFDRLAAESGGRIRRIELPEVKSTLAGTDFDKRGKLLEVEAENDFERFLVRTLLHSFPRLFIEMFGSHYDAYKKDINRRNYRYIVTEVWISHIRTSIYLATARLHGVRIILQQHGASTQWHRNNLIRLELAAADIFLSTGWRSDDPKVVPGGFATREIRPYRFRKQRGKILYVSCTRLPFLIQFNQAEANTVFIRILRNTAEFIDRLPDEFRRDFVLRPRREPGFWDTEHTLEVERKNIRVDHGDFSESISKARIVVIDHLSTGIAEILMNRIPCLIIHDERIEPLAEDFADIFDELIECGVVHGSPESAVEKLKEIYDDVEAWWKSPEVENAVETLVSRTLGPPSKTIDYLLSRLKN